ncbi:hypothetical protein B566_EDAN015530 [Ephemera danica]|nr:hypothetical protein B566_EDAN015530 [Ephemera danica]
MSSHVHQVTQGVCVGGAVMRHRPRCALLVLLLQVLAIAPSSSTTRPSELTTTLLPPTLPPPALLLPCDGLDTCQQGLPQAPRSPRPLLGDNDWKERNCLCDQLCARYGDCCDDAPTVTRTATERRDFVCEDMRNFGGIYMIGTCASTWRGDEETKRRCEETMDPSDPLSSSVPVTDKATATTYRNLHCALCNLDSTDSDKINHAREHWEMWGARLECPTVLTGSRGLASVHNALQFENGTWGLRLPRNVSGTVPRPPQRTQDEKSSKLILDQIEPFISKNETTSRPRVPRNRSLRRLTTTTTTEAPTPSVTISSGLRNLSRRQYALYNASQFHRNDSALDRLLSLRRRVHIARAKRDVLTTEEEELIFHKCDVDPLLPDTLTHLVRRCRPKVIGSCPESWADNKVREMCEAHTAHVFSGGSTYRNVYCAMCSGLPVQQLACQQAGVSMRGHFNKNFNTVAFAVLFDFGRGHGTVGAASCPERGQFYDPFLGICRSLVCTAGTVVLSGESRGSCVANDQRRTIEVEQTEELAASRNETRLHCESDLHMLSDEEFSIMKPEMKLIVATTGAQLEQEKYQILENGSAFICNPTQYNFTLHNDTGDKFGAMLGYITLVGLGISIICLTLHLLAFCLVSEKHGGGSGAGNSNSAKNLASLCIALLVAYFSFLAGQLVRDDRDFCVSSAIVTYYSFLAAFTWMFAVSLDIWRSLRLATTQLRTSYSGRKQWRKFFLNSVCCWLIPACIVLAAIVVENAAPDSVDDEMRPGFGIRPGICWFSNRRSLLVFFAAPISIIMLLNAIFFTSSALMIYSTTASTSGGPRRDFRLYLRLAVLMGLTWSVGLLAGFLDTPLLWVVFVVLNTLQGLFIFLGFTCTEKMSRSLRERLWHCWCCWRRHRRHRRGDLVTSSLGVPPGDPTALGVRKLGVPNSLDHLPWSAFSSSVLSSSKSSQSEESSRDTDETLY